MSRPGPSRPSTSSGLPSSGPSYHRGLKGFFTRSKSPEPLVSLSTSIHTSFTPAPSAESPSRPAHLAAAGGNVSRNYRKPAVPRPPSAGTGEVWRADAEAQRTLRSADGKRIIPAAALQSKRIRIAPSVLPAMQKGEDGRWQPPSLSRGSMSTSAIALYARETNQVDGEDVGGPFGSRDDDGDVIMDGLPADRDKGKGKAKQAFTALFSTAKFGSSVGGEVSISPKSKGRPAERNDDQTTRHKRPPSRTDKALPATPRSRSPVKDAFDATPRPNWSMPTATPTGPDSSASMTPLARAAGSVGSAGSAGSTGKTHLHRRAQSNPPIIRAPLESPAPPTVPPHSRGYTDTLTPLSEEHFLIRLSASFMVKCLVPLLRGSSFLGNAKHADMRRAADTRLTTLERMERNWGRDWTEAASMTIDAEGSAAGVNGDLASRMKAVRVGQRQKERERRILVDALRDGILLCFLFNYLMPHQPPHIARVNISEDGLIRHNNLSRFLAACHTVELPAADTFSISDLQIGSEVGLAMVARSVLALARKSTRLQGSPRPQTPSMSDMVVSPATSPIPSRTASRAASPTTSPLRRSIELQISQHAVLHLHRAQVRPEIDPVDSLQEQLEGGMDITPPSSGLQLHPAAPITPVKPPSTAGSRSYAHPQPASPSPMVVRASTSPASPTRSPSGVPSRLQANAGQAKMVLRPRHSVSSRVSFAGEPPSPRTVPQGYQARPNIGGGGHARERTPSLITASSRPTSAYTRASTVLSVDTVTDDHIDHAIDVNAMEEDEMDVHRRARSWDRRESEQTLHNARIKILGTLLSSEDLPEDLRREEEHAVSARGLAIQESLRTLEGRLSPTRARSNAETPIPSAPPTPTRRPAPRRGHTIDNGHLSSDRLSEADEVASSDSGGSAFSTRTRNGSMTRRPSMLRRTSIAGKIYIPKRSASPSGRSQSGSMSPLSPPSMPSLPTLDSDSLIAASTSPTLPPTHKDDKNGKRSANAVSHSLRPGSAAESPSRDTPGPKPRWGSADEYGNVTRSSSAVQLAFPGSSAYSMVRDDSNQSGVRGPGQTLVFDEPGQAPVRYQLGNCVGKGQFGSVYRSLHLGNGQMVAIKRIHLHGMEETEVRDVMKEVELLKTLDHPSIVKYEGMSRDDEYLNIVLEFVENGSLGQTIRSFGVFNEQLASSHTAKILEGLGYLHSQGVVHCDLKAANILSTKSGNVKLSDFGVSLNMKAVENIKQEVQTHGRNAPNIGDVAGTPNWMAPEVISLNGASPASDIWSLGCTIIELLTGKPPYADIANSMSVLFRIVEDTMVPLPPVSLELEDFLKLCFIKDPQYRPSAAKLFEHIWIRKSNPGLQLLRPQDSVPFLRRVSMNSGRADATRIFANDGFRPAVMTAHLMDRYEPKGEQSKRSSLASAREGVASRVYAPTGLSPDGHGKRSGKGHDAFRSRAGSTDVETELDNASRHVPNVAHHWRHSNSPTPWAGPPRPHTFIKTSFGKAIICRICHSNVKRVGVVCQSCGLIAHASCAQGSASRCDVHEQYAMYARQQEYTPSAESSAAVSPQTGHQVLADHHIKELQQKLLSGIKKSKDALRRSQTFDQSDYVANVSQRAETKRQGMPARSITLATTSPNPADDDAERHNRRQDLKYSQPGEQSSRVSMISNASVETSHEDARRRSALRFDMGRAESPPPVSDESAGRRSQHERKGDSGRLASVMVSEVQKGLDQRYGGNGGSGPMGYGNGSKRDSRSDCTIQ